MRKLAHIERIVNIRPIEGADKIEAVDILGWTVVSQKGIHKVGDLVVYFEIDSWLDSTIPAIGNDEGFKARFSNWQGSTGMRLRTIKLRGQISQGLIMSINAFPELALGNKVAIEEGADVTEVLGILKWERPETGGGASGQMPARGRDFPYFIKKTDQERVQNYVGVLPQHEGETYEKTVKLDGSSMTVYHVNKGSPYFEAALEGKQRKSKNKLGLFGKLLATIKDFFASKPLYVQGTCSRNLLLDDTAQSTFQQVVTDLQIYQRLDNLNRNVAIQGELIAPSIQGNYEKVSKPEFYIFDVFDIDKQEYLLPGDARQLADELGLDYVPVLDVAANMPPLSTGLESPQEAQRRRVEIILGDAEGPGKNAGVKREGIVWKSNTTPFSFKAISNSYLLHKEKSNKD